MEKTITSRLGFGLMRLPTCQDGQIDKQQMAQMADIALENGVNYFDTAYFYHNGESENAAGEILGKKPRESFILADKMPMSMVEKKEDIERIFNQQLEKCQTEYFDYYLLHALNRNNFEKVKDFDAVAFFREKQKEGRIKKFGFSFHDTADILKEIIAYTSWDFVQLQLNYYDISRPDPNMQYTLARENNLPIIVMEPIRGGFLANTVPNGQKLIEKSYGKDKGAALALSYISSLPGIMLVLSGMSNIDQLKDNIETFKNPITMDEKAKEVINNIIKEIEAFKTVDCTSCNYCRGCPKDIDIPKVFAIYNSYETFKNQFSTKNALKELGATPDMCISCHKCETKCPQRIEIANAMHSFAKIIEQFT